MKIKEKRLRLYLFLGVTLFTLALYLKTTAPTVVFWDVGEFLATSYILGVPHPPGTPFYVLLGRVFALLPIPFLNVVQRITLIAILSGALTAGLAYLITVKVIDLFKTEKLSPWIQHFSGVLAGVLGTTAYTTWWSSIEAETYSPSNFVMFLCTYLALLWWENRNKKDALRYLILILYVMALGTGIHLGVLIVFPAIFLFVAIIKPRSVFDWEMLGIISVFLGFVGILKTTFNPPDWGGGFVLFVIGTAGVLLFLYQRKFIRTLGAKETVLSTGILLVVVGFFTHNMFLFVAGGLWTFILSFIMGNLYREYKGFAFILILIAVSAEFYLIIRAHYNPHINEVDPKSWSAFWEVLLRKQYEPMKILPRRIPFIDQLKLFWDYFYGRGDLIETGQYVPLIYLLGFIGVAIHLAYERKSFALVGGALIMGTLGLILVLNLKYSATDPIAAHTPREVRDREYFFIPGYFYFAIYAGIGFYGAFKLAVENLKPFKKFALPLSIPLFLLLPSWQIGRFYHMADRSNNRIAMQYASNLLNSCEDGSILFTNGDNDTFPLWFAQEVPGIKHSVINANLSLINTPWYNKQLKERGVPMYFTKEEIDKLHPFMGSDRKIVLVRDLMIRDILAANFGYSLPRDPKEYFMLRTGVRIPKIYIEPPEKFAQEVIQGKKPKITIYFSITVEAGVYRGFNDFLVLEGLVYKVVPDKVPEDERTISYGTGIDLQKTDSLLHKVYRYDGIIDENGKYDRSVFKDYTHHRLLGNYRATTLFLGMYYAGMGELEKAIKNVKLSVEFAGNEEFMDQRDQLMLYVTKHYLMELYNRVGNYDKAIETGNELVEMAKTRDVYASLGNANLGLGKIKSAKKYYKLATQLRPLQNPLSPFIGLINIYISQGQKDSALILYNELAKQNLRKEDKKILDSLKSMIDKL